MCGGCGFVFPQNDDAAAECPSCGRTVDAGAAASAFQSWWSREMRRGCRKCNSTDFESVEQKEKEKHRW